MSQEEKGEEENRLRKQPHKDVGRILLTLHSSFPHKGADPPLEVILGERITLDGVILTLAQRVFQNQK